MKPNAATAPKKVEEEMPVVFSCPICTFQNAISVGRCEMCDTERPPMEVILADFRAVNKALEASNEEEKAVGDITAEASSVVPKKTFIEEKLAGLFKDLKRIISRVQRRKYKE